MNGFLEFHKMLFKSFEKPQNVEKVQKCNVEVKAKNVDMYIQF